MLCDILDQVLTGASDEMSPSDISINSYFKDSSLISKDTSFNSLQGCSRDISSKLP